MSCLHCSICEVSASFVALRHKMREPLCDQHWDWLVENSSQIPKFERITPCDCAPIGGKPKKERKPRVRIFAGKSLEAKRAAMRAYYHRNREALLAYNAKYQRENRGRIAQIKKEHYLKNRDKIRAYQREYDRRKREESMQIATMKPRRIA